MRFVLLLLISTLAGCFGGCETAGGTLSWLQPGIGDQLAQAPEVQVTQHEAWGIPLDAPSAHAFLGDAPHFISLSVEDGPRIVAPDGAVQVAGYVAAYPEVGPGPESHRQDAVRLLSRFMAEEEAKAWADEHLGDLRRDVSYSVALEVPIDLAAALDEAQGDWEVAGDATLRTKDGMWRLAFDRVSYWIPGHRAVDVVGGDRIIVDLYDHDGGRETAMPAAGEVLAPYKVTPQAPAGVTWTDQVVCYD